MSAITIAAAIGGTIITVIVLVYVSQYRQRTQDARQREMNTLQEKLRQFKMLATALPPQFITPQIKVLLGQRAIETLERLGQLDRPDDFQDQIVEWKAYQESAKAAPTAQQGKNAASPTGNQIAVTETRHLLKILYRFIESQIKHRRLEKAIGAQNLEQTLYFISKVLADAHVAKARQVYKDGRYRIAIHHYHDAISAYSPLPNNAQAQKVVEQYRLQIKELEKQATAAQEAKNMAAPSAAATTQLGADLENLVTKQDTWKKKQTYDD
jgi:hypothetical protein